MNRRKTAWIPIAILLLFALVLFFFTLWMGAEEYSAASGAFTGRGIRPAGFIERLTETVFLEDLWHSLALRLASLALGCLLGWAVSLPFRRLTSPVLRGLIAALGLVFAFVPSRLLTSLPPLSLIGHVFLRSAVSLALPVFSLSLFSGTVLSSRYKKTAALLPLAAGAVFVLTPDLDTALGIAGEWGTLDAWSVSLMKSGSYTSSAQVSVLKTVPECLAALLPALLILGGRDKNTDRAAASPKGSAGGTAAALCAALAASLALLVPFLLSAADLASRFASDAFFGSLTSAGIAFAVTLAVSAAVLLTAPRGRGMMGALAAALAMLSAFSAAKCALAAQAGSNAAASGAVLSAFSPLPMTLLLCLTVLLPEGKAVRLRGAFACAALSGALASFSSLFSDVLGVPSLGGLLSSGLPEPSGIVVLLACPLLMYILAALLLSSAFAPAPVKEDREDRHVYLAQGWSARGGGAAAAVSAGGGDTGPAPASREEEKPENTPVIRTAVPAGSNYAAQFARAQAPRTAPAEASPVVPEGEEPVSEDVPETASPYSRPSDLPVPGVRTTPREEEIPENAPPSPAQIVSMINALTRMKSMGIMDEADYRDKYDRLMKML